MMNTPKLGSALLLCLSLFQGGCGLEELVTGAILPEPEIVPPPGSVQLIGSLEGNPLTVDMRFYTAAGQEIDPYLIEIDRQSNPATFYAFLFSDQNLYNLRVVSHSDGITRKAIIPSPLSQEVYDVESVDLQSTAMALALEVKGPFASAEGDDLSTPSPSPSPSPEGEAGFWRLDETPTPTSTQALPVFNGEISSVATHPCDGVMNFQDILRGQIATNSGPILDLIAALETEFEGGETTYPDVIYGADALSEPLLEPALESAASASTAAELDPDNIRVFMGVKFEQGHPDGKCYAVDIFKWVNPDEGDTMFFVGGIHEDSEIQDPVIQNEVFPDWVPNTLPLYDDGTHGDESAGDNIWTLSMVLPRGLRFGYKYTYGAQGENWTGTEEWPGNQRILEVIDVNNDGYVARFDIFADERSNKDVSNLYEIGGTTVSWETDLNGDGFIEAREQPADFIDADCVKDGWWVPVSLPPVTEKGCD